MIRSVIKHLQCGVKKDNQKRESNIQEPKERTTIVKCLRSLRNRSNVDKKRLEKIDELEVEWTNSPKSRLRRNGFDIPVYG